MCINLRKEIPHNASIMFNKPFEIHRLSPDWIISLFLIIATLAVFSPLRHHEFVGYDDDKFIYENPYIQEGLTWKSIQWAFSADLTSDSPNADFWIPLTFLSHILTIELFGMEPSGHHLVNLGFHVINTVLLFWVLRRMTGSLWPSAFVAALFSLHPLHVESVAWVTERKDVLSTLFWFLTMGAYVRYTNHPTVGRYLLVALSLALGLMAKPMLITLPFVLLLLDYWPLGRFQGKPLKEVGKLIWEKIPLFILVGISLIITYLALQGGEHLLALEMNSLWSRISNALGSYLTYLRMMLWPSGLAVFYPHPGDTIPLWETIGVGMILVGISAGVFWRRKQKAYLVVGWLWYLGTLFPTLGWLQAGFQALADRYTYVPLIGLFIMVAFGVSDLTSKWPYRRGFLNGLAGGTLSVLMVCTWFQVQHWRNTITLFEHTVKVTEKNYVAHHNLGFAYQREGRFNDAIREYRKAVIFDPDFAMSHYSLGFLYQEQGRFEEAIQSYQKAVALEPNLANAHFFLGNVYYKQGRLDKAIQSYQKTLTITPNSPGTHNNLGLIYEELGQRGKAIKEFEIALKLYPFYTEARRNLENVLKQEKN